MTGYVIVFAARAVVVLRLAGAVAEIWDVNLGHSTSHVVGLCVLRYDERIDLRLSRLKSGAIGFIRELSRYPERGTHSELLQVLKEDIRLSVTILCIRVVLDRRGDVLAVFLDGERTAKPIFVQLNGKRVMIGGVCLGEREVILHNAELAFVVILHLALVLYNDVIEVIVATIGPDVLEGVCLVRGMPVQDGFFLGLPMKHRHSIQSHRQRVP